MKKEEIITKIKSNKRKVAAICSVIILLIGVSIFSHLSGSDYIIKNDTDKTKDKTIIQNDIEANDKDFEDANEKEKSYDQSKIDSKNDIEISNDKSDLSNEEYTSVNSNKTDKENNPSGENPLDKENKPSGGNSENTTKPQEPQISRCNHKWEVVDITDEYALFPLSDSIGACNSCGQVVVNGLTGDDIVKEHMLETVENGSGHGSWHSDFYQEGYCYYCGGHFSYRQCCWGDKSREQCKNSENFVIVKEESGNAYMYYESCSCSSNAILVGESGNGLIKKGSVERCVYCGEKK